MENNKKRRILLWIGIIVSSISTFTSIYLLGKSQCYKKEVDRLSDENNKLRDRIPKEYSDGYNYGHRKGYRKGYDEGYNDGVEDPISSYSSSKLMSEKKGLKEGIEIGRTITLEGMSYPNLSNPDQIKLATENGILLNKVGIDEATKAVLNSDPNLEMENYLKNKVMESYNEV